MKNAPLEVAPPGPDVDEDTLLDAIRSYDEAGALQMLEAAPAISLRVVKAAFAYELPALVGRLAQLSVVSMSGATSLLRWLAGNEVLMNKIRQTPAWWPPTATWTTRLLAEVPEGWQRVDAAKAIARKPEILELAPGAEVRGSRTALVVELEGLVVSMKTRGHFTKTEVHEAGSSAAEKLLSKKKSKKPARRPEPKHDLPDWLATALGARVRKQLTRLGAILPTEAPPLDGKSAAIAALSQAHFPGRHWLIEKGDDDGYELAFTQQAPTVELAASHDPPLFELGWSATREYHLVLECEDGRTDPLVFAFHTDDPSDFPLKGGRPLSSVLRQVRVELED